MKSWQYNLDTFLGAKKKNKLLFDRSSVILIQVLFHQM